MAGSRGLGVWFAAAALVGGAACGEDAGQTTPADGFDRAALFTSLATNVIEPALVDFESSANALETATSVYASAAVSGPATDEKAAAQDAWRVAMTAWQRVEMMQVGPAAAPPATGAASLRDEIYSWPTVSPCAVDQQLTAEGYADTDFIENRLVSVYGLDALEYLLFYAGADNACASAASINRDGLWDAIDADTLRRRRAAYAAVVATGVGQHAARLRDAWLPKPDQTDVAAQWVAAVSGTSIYDSASAVIDDIFAAIFYVDTFTKDAKLGEVLGITTECETIACGPQRRESPWAEHSRENIVANLEALQRLFHGGPSPNDDVGFDDFLVARDGASVATSLTTKITAALSAARALDGTLIASVEANPTAVDALYTRIAEVTDLLRGGFVLVLKVTIPPSGLGDVD